MPVYKDNKRNTWYVQYKTKDWTGKTKSIWKRGFKTKREAVQWEATSKTIEKNSINLTLEDFITKVYMPQVSPRLKEVTIQTKMIVYRNQIIPYLGNKKLTEITNADILNWQNTIITSNSNNTGKPYSNYFLKYVNDQLKAVFRFAMKYYNLKVNPVELAGKMHKVKHEEMKFWTLEQFTKFSYQIMDRPALYYAFMILYWCGLRSGEMFALRLEDIDFEKKTISVTKTLCVVTGKPKYETSPKTAMSVREVTMPDFLCEELQDYVKHIYMMNPTDHLFPFSRSTLAVWLRDGARAAGLPEIRVHDLRHSHISLLINKGFTALSIGKRVGHSSSDITYRYAHLFPNVKDEVADALNRFHEEVTINGEEKGTKKNI